MTDKTTLDTSKLLGFDKNGSPLYDIAIPASAQDASQSHLTGAQKDGIVKPTLSGDVKN